MNDSLKRLILFLSIAFIVSNIFRFDVLNIQDQISELPTWLFVILSVLLEGSGVFIGALMALFLLRKKQETEISLLGTSKYLALIMAIIPVVLLGFFGVTNDHGLNPHVYGLIAILGSLVYCIMEEYGWRGYLQEEWKEKKPILRYALIGFIWYAWHLSFLKETSIQENLTFLGILMVASWGIGQVVDSTKSILAGTCFHLIVNIVSFNMLFKNGIEGNDKWIILGVSVGLWLILLQRWKKEAAFE